MPINRLSPIIDSQLTSDEIFLGVQHYLLHYETSSTLLKSMHYGFYVSRYGACISWVYSPHFHNGWMDCRDAYTCLFTFFENIAILVWAYHFARKNGWHAPQKLIIGTLISQYASYLVMFCLLHSNISKKQDEIRKNL